MGEVERVVEPGLALPWQVAQFAPGVEAAPIHDVGIGVGDHVDAAQGIFMVVAGVDAGGAGVVVLGDELTGGVDVVFLLYFAALAFAGSLV